MDIFLEIENQIYRINEILTKEQYIYPNYVLKHFDNLEKITQIKEIKCYNNNLILSFSEFELNLFKDRNKNFFINYYDFIDYTKYIDIINYINANKNNINNVYQKIIFHIRRFSNDYNNENKTVEKLNPLSVINIRYIINNLKNISYNIIDKIKLIPEYHFPEIIISYINVICSEDKNLTFEFNIYIDGPGTLNKKEYNKFINSLESELSC
jgi:hypothetical protein